MAYYTNPYKLSLTLPPKPPNLIGFWVHSKLDDNDPNSHWYRFVTAMQQKYYDRVKALSAPVAKTPRPSDLVEGLRRYDAISVMTVNSYRFIEFPTEEAYTRFLLEW